MEKKLRPIIKWTGGKYNEFSLFAHSIPAFDRYIEPFFGGGGVFFALQPKVSSLINDKSTGLINFYREVKNPNLYSELFRYVAIWEALSSFNTEMWLLCKVEFSHYSKGKLTLTALTQKIEPVLSRILEKSNIFTDSAFVIDPIRFSQYILASMVDKSKRIKQICEKEQKSFAPNELADHFETGIRSGAYLFFRAILNDHFNHKLELDPARAAANWYFVREFCYGSMFRFNARGEFNIPYGGITYNRKNFKQKVEQIFAPEIKSLFDKATLENQDFELFLKGIKLTARDFIFLDPPYDSEFSEYDQSAFTRADQKRLADFLIDTKAQWMVVIKETDFIRKLYDHPKIHVKVFVKNYAYNVRGRNNRNVNHLIITNYFQ